MKKMIYLGIIIVLIVIGIFIYRGYKSNNTNSINNNTNISNNAKSNSGEITLKYEYDGKTYEADINLSEDDKIIDFDKENAESITIKNEKENYVLDIFMHAQSSGSCEEHQTISKENNNSYTDTKYGNYDGFIVTEDEEGWGDIIMDTTDENAYKLLTFSFYANDKNKENIDVQAMFNLPSIQSILNSVNYKNK